MGSTPTGPGKADEGLEAGRPPAHAHTHTHSQAAIGDPAASRDFGQRLGAGSVAEELRVIAIEGWKDPVFFFRYFLHDWFPKEIPWVHRGIIAIQLRKTDFLLKYGELEKIEANFTYKADPDDDQSSDLPLFHVVRDEAGTPIRVDLVVTKFVSIKMPRGYSKTTICNACVVYEIAYQECQFPVYVSEAQGHANMQLKAVKTQFESNEKITAVFGSLKPDQRTGKKWSEDMIETTTGITVAARGRGGQVRGLNNNAARPDRIIVDDVEDKESVATPEQRAKAKTWFYGDVIPALPELKEEAYIVVLGTLLNAEALLAKLEHDPTWTNVTFGVTDHQGDPLWPLMMDAAKIAAKKQAFVRAGMAAIWYMEYENKIRSDETAKFRVEFFIYGDTERELFKGIALDPAISNDPDADYSAVVVGGMEGGGRIHVLDVWGKRGATPREQIDIYFEKAKLWRPQKHGIESIGYQAALIHLMREEMFRKKYYFEPIPITHKQKKEERVEGILQPRFAAGYIVFRRRFPLLEQQLLDWPNGKMDEPDALAMMIALLDPYAALASPEDFDLAKDEYESLERAMGGSFDVAP